MIWQAISASYYRTCLGHRSAFVAGFFWVRIDLERTKRLDK
jgi:hypothetical protein